MRNKKGFLNLDNKGFAITSIIYSMILLFIILMTLTILTLGRKKVLLDKTKNETLGFFSQLKDYPCTVTTKSSAGIDIGIGDVITCKTESFFVVSNDGTNIEMLAKYNLNVGNNKIDGDTEGIQSVNAIGSNHISPKYYSKASLSFSDTNYWNGSGSYPTYVYNNNSFLYQYVENYATYLRNVLEIQELTASLVDYSKLMSLGCVQNSCKGAPSWVYSTTYWTGTAIDANHIKYLYNDGNTTSGDTYSFSSNYGVRPLVTIPTNKVRNPASNIENPPIVVPEEGHTGVKAIVYLDPANLNRKCTESDVKSETGTKTGCMKWYAYDEDATTYTMILDHNTTATIDNWNNRTSQLTSDTSGWDSSLNPRLMPKDEILSIIDAEKFVPFGSEYGWLYDTTSISCISSGCLNNATGNGIDRMIGYWLDTIDYSNVAYNIHYSGMLNNSNMSVTSFGVRPVITVQKSLLNELD